MKKIIISLLLLTIAKATFSQQTPPSPALTRQDWLQKSKHQKTAAWVMLTGGFALSATGIITAAPKAAKDIGYGIMLFPNLLAGNVPPAPQNDYTAETFLIIGGTAAMLSSIPLFIASGKNKKKAMSLSFKNENVPQIYKGSLVYNNIPSLTLKFKL